jgi:hypothetical protein
MENAIHFEPPNDEPQNRLHHRLASLSIWIDGGQSPEVAA